MLSVTTICIIFFITVLNSNAFISVFKSSLVTRTSLNVLSDDVLSQLSEMKEKYDRISNVDSPETNEQASSMKETVEKYTTYLEVTKLMTKLRLMYVNEASEQRKAKQLKSFMQLHEGRVEIEQILNEKLGRPVGKKAVAEGIDEIKKFDEQIATLESKLKEVEVKLPEGQLTRFERFAR